MTRMPKAGEEVRWSTPQGETRGTVEAVVTKPTKVKGHTAKATKDAPEVLVRSEASGKAAVHRPDALKRA